MSYRADLSMSGGGNTARYFVSLSYVEDQGMYNTDETLRKKYDTNANYKRWNYRMNVDIDVTPTTIIKLGVSGNSTNATVPVSATNTCGANSLASMPLALLFSIPMVMFQPMETMSIK